METDSVFCLLAANLRVIFEKNLISRERLEEIRLRANAPLFVRYDGTEYAVKPDGTFSGDDCLAYCVTKEDIDETLEYISGYSLYAFSEEIRQGFITVAGGHRIGIAGKIVAEGRKVQCVRHISFINIRLAHQRIGCADLVMPSVATDNKVFSTLIISPPGCGKTTLLRDMVRQISNGINGHPGKNVGVVDERSEIAGTYLGIPQNDVGMRTDVLDCCPKSIGMMMLLRSMSPQVIAVDEIGSREDKEAIETIHHCGCKLLATVHGTSVEEVWRHPFFHDLAAQSVFERYIVLDGKNRGRVKVVTDEKNEILYQGA